MDTINKPVFFIDHSDSMVAFTDLVKAALDGCCKSCEKYYFGNLPLQFLSEGMACVPKELEDLHKLAMNG